MRIATVAGDADWPDDWLRKLMIAIRGLPDDYQMVLRLRRLNLPVPEMARRMSRSENAVRVLYWRALSSLGRRLGLEY